MPGTLHIPRGLPASGKTTFARAMVDTRPAGEVIRLNRDELRAMALPSGYARPAHTAEEGVTLVQRSAIADLLRRGVDVIIDDTNLRAKHVRELDRIAASVGAETVLHDQFLDVPVEECVARDAARGEWGGRSVGAEVIRGMHQRYLSGGRRLPPIDRDEAPTGKPYHPAPGSIPAIMVDIDGTVALHCGRDPYDTSRYHEDAPNTSVVEAVRMAAAAGLWVLFCSGRSKEFEIPTMRWLGQHVITDDMVWDLYMRSADDLRNDAIVKLELFDQHIRDRFDVRWVYDDRDRVVKAWRSIGLTVMQVAEGAF